MKRSDIQQRLDLLFHFIYERGPLVFFIVCETWSEGVYLSLTHYLFYISNSNKIGPLEIIK